MRLAAVLVPVLVVLAGCGNTPVVRVSAPQASRTAAAPEVSAQADGGQPGGSVTPPGTSASGSPKASPKPSRQPSQSPLPKSSMTLPSKSITAVTMKVSPGSFSTSPCIQWDQTVRIDFTVEVATTTPTRVSFDVQSSVGLLRSGRGVGYPTENGVAWGFLTVTLKVGPERPETITLWLDVTEPSSRQSSRFVFENSCA